jgi:hypothetical protein
MLKRFKAYCRDLTESYLQEQSPAFVTLMEWALCSEQKAFAYLRVLTWPPFRLQFYCNGHNLLARRLDKKKINYEKIDNVFVQIDDLDKAQKFADGINVKRIWEMKDAPLKTSIYSTPMLVELMKASNRRYLEFISAIDDPSGGIKDLNKISRSVKDGGRSCRGFNLFDGNDLELFGAIIRGEFNISGLSNRCLHKVFKDKKGQQVSRLLKRLRKHGLIKKIANTYKYYLTALGCRVTATVLKLREMYIISSLRGMVVRWFIFYDHLETNFICKRLIFTRYESVTFEQNRFYKEYILIRS